jgi:ArsR family transcriptional regulator, repressor of sdpIR and other operons
MQSVWEALADPHRRTILTLLKDGEKSVGELHQHFEFSGATLSHHLNKLKAADLVIARRKGQQMIYAVHMSTFEEAAQMMAGLFGKEEKI